MIGKHPRNGRDQISIILQGLKRLFFKLLNVVTEAATHKDRL
jgi:hypothetical protein